MSHPGALLRGVLLFMTQVMRSCHRSGLEFLKEEEKHGLNLLSILKKRGMMLSRNMS
jgi:hypothetical protein